LFATVTRVVDDDSVPGLAETYTVCAPGTCGQQPAAAPTGGVTGLDTTPGQTKPTFDGPVGGDAADWSNAVPHPATTHARITMRATADPANFPIASMSGVLMIG